MADSGWYPDPSGIPGRYRYWDGQQWSPATSADPSAPPPGANPQPRRGRGGALIAALAAVLVLAVIVTLAVRSFGTGRDSVRDDPHPPPPTASGWDDSSPLPTASPTPTRTPSPSPSEHDPGDDASVRPPGQVACADGNPSAHELHPGDGRIHGGRLSIAQPGGSWVRDDGYAAGLSYAWDVSGASDTVETYWWAMLAVGALHATDGFKHPKQAAEALMQCTATSGYYQHRTGVKTLSSKRFTLAGHSGWAIRSEIRVDDPRVHAEGDVVEVIVLDTGDAGRLSFFAGFVPIGDAARIDTLDNTIAGLRVD
ncbi:DUF2510 domain-containing protein [Microlunatus elymi]|uniref:DUF2510 domain-containing protein n=1 Tax=Microlunatus elymi TaxID=2596828 RepID=UPI00143CF0B3|nr:DUF2510 domain-containing protein [Microlunatus elymi]